MTEILGGGRVVDLRNTLPETNGKFTSEIQWFVQMTLPKCGMSSSLGSVLVVSGSFSTSFTWSMFQPAMLGAARGS